MAAAAAAAAVQLQRRSTIRFSSQKQKQPELLTVHLRGIIKDEDEQNPIAVLEGLAECDSRKCDPSMAKLTSHGTWLQTRFIATKDRIFLLLKTSTVEDKDEVVDSVPMHEIIGLKRISHVNELKNAARASSFSLDEETCLRASRACVRTKEQDGERELEDQDARTDNNGGLGLVDGTHIESIPVFEIQTHPEGFNQGRSLIVLAGHESSCREWMQKIEQLSETAKSEFMRKNRFQCYQRTLRKFYDRTAFRVVVCLSIVANFVISMLEAQLGDGSNLCTSVIPSERASAEVEQTAALFRDLDMAFTIFFVAELLLNFTANAFWPFWRDKWNLFDVFVVFSSVAFLMVSNANNGLIKQIRILRVFRVLRAFGKIRQMREMVNAIVASIFPAMEALLIGVIVLAMFANIGKEYFANQAPRYFCDFSHAFYTCFGMAAYKKFPDDVQVFNDDGDIVTGTAFFVYIFVAVVVLLLLQIVVAVLLENFYKAMHREREASKDTIPRNQDVLSGSKHSMDPLLEDLSAFDTQSNFDARADDIFRAFDVNATGGLSFAEVFDGLYKAKGARLQIEEFQRMTKGGTLCSQGQEVDRATFRGILAKEMRDFLLRRMAEAQAYEDVPAELRSLLTVSKVLLLELDDAVANVASMEVAALEAGEEVRAELALQREELRAEARRAESLAQRLRFHGGLPLGTAGGVGGDARAHASPANELVWSHHAA